MNTVQLCVHQVQVISKRHNPLASLKGTYFGPLKASFQYSLKVWCLPARSTLISSYNKRMQKRQLDRSEGEDGDHSIDTSSLKRAKVDATSTELVAVPKTSQALTLSRSAEPGRTSALMAPEVALVGHEGAVYSIAWDPSGMYMCSGSFDKQIFLWDIFEGGCKNYNVLSGHKSAVLQVCWPSLSSIVSCSADKTVATWDASKGIRTRKFLEHTAVVNSCSVASDAPHLIASGSDDCTVILWDARARQSVASIYHDYQVTAVCLSPDGKAVYTGGIDNTIRRFDLRCGGRAGWDAGSLGNLDDPELVLEGHSDTITGLALSPDGANLLSNAMDSQLRIWDVRPFAAGGTGNGDSRCEEVLTGVHHGAEKLLLKCAWSPDQEYITAGSADRLVHLWDATTHQQLPSWPGHRASVNQVIFHPTERIIASCSSDKSIILGELPPL